MDGERAVMEVRAHPEPDWAGLRPYTFVRLLAGEDQRATFNVRIHRRCSRGPRACCASCWLHLKYRGPSDGVVEFRA